MRHAFEIDATPHEVWLGRESGEYILHLDNERLPVSLSLDDQGHGSLRIDGETVPITLARRGDDCFIHLDGSTWQLRYRDPLERASALAHGSATSTAWHARGRCSSATASRPCSIPARPSSSCRRSPPNMAYDGRCAGRRHRSPASASSRAARSSSTPTMRA
jgi:hypothetical protein